MSLQSRKSTDRQSAKLRSSQVSERSDDDYFKTNKLNKERWETAVISIGSFDQCNEAKQNPFIRISNLSTENDTTPSFEKSKSSPQPKILQENYEFKRLEKVKITYVNSKNKESKQMFLWPADLSKLERNVKRRISENQIVKEKLDTQNVWYQMTIDDNE